MPHKSEPTHNARPSSSDSLESLDPQRVISLLPLRPYQVVGDIGCGPGYITIPLGKYLFDGKVYAVDTQQEMLDALKERLDQVHLSNVEMVLASGDKALLKEDLLDGALVAFVLHETQDRRAFLEQVMSSLHKGGWLAILEWYKKEMDEGPPLDVRISEGEVRQMAEEVGFRFQMQRDLNSKEYMLLMRK